MNYRFAIPLLLAAATLVACNNSDSTTVGTTAPNISVAQVAQDSITLFASYPGYLEAFDYVDLVARVSGYQVASHYTPGKHVNKGDTMFIIEPTQYQDAVAQAEAALATAKSEFYYAENNYKRMKDVANSNAISEIDLIKSEAAYYQAEAAIKSAEAALQSARTQLNYCYVVAPISGTPTSSAYSNGDYLAPGANARLATIYQDNKLFAYFSVDDAQYMKLIQNLRMKNTRLSQDAVRLSFSEVMPHEYVGYIDYIAPNIDLATGTLKVRIVVDNPHGELKHGMYTTVHMPYTRSEKAILVNDASIGTDQVGKYLYIVNDSNKVELRHIQLGELYNDSLRVVSSGVEPGERYVTRALQKVHEGMIINPITH